MISVSYILNDSISPYIHKTKSIKYSYPVFNDETTTDDLPAEAAASLIRPSVLRNLIGVFEKPHLVKVSNQLFSDDRF